MLRNGLKRQLGGGLIRHMYITISGCRVAQLVEQTLEVGKGNVSPDFQAEGRRFESAHDNKDTVRCGSSATGQ